MGDGASMYVKTPNKSMVIDCGASDDFSPADYIKNTLGVSTINRLVVSHPHRDHINDILKIKEHFGNKGQKIELLKRNKEITKDLLIESNNKLKDDEYVEGYYELEGKFNGGNISEADLDFGGVERDYFQNKNTDEKPGNSTINNLSVVTFIKFGKDVVLYGGDMEKEGWETIMKKPGFDEWLQKTTIYLASHHGNKSGYYSEMFKSFKPKITIVPAGKKPNYDAADKYHDKTEGMEITNKDGKKETRKVLTTRKDGHIHITLHDDDTKPTVELGYLSKTS